MSFKKIAIIGKYNNLKEDPSFSGKLRALIDFIVSKKIQVFVEEKTQQQFKLNSYDSIALSQCEDVDLIIVL